MRQRNAFDPETSKLGTELTSEDQAYALATYVHRFTREHKPTWANREWKDGKPYPVQFASDQDWLAHTRFAVSKTGRLIRSPDCDCYSQPTWPDNNGVMPGNSGARG